MEQQKLKGMLLARWEFSHISEAESLGSTLSLKKFRISLAGERKGAVSQTNCFGIIYRKVSC